MFGFGRSNDCEFRGAHLRDWIFIENITGFNFVMDIFERLQREINNEKIIHIKGKSLFI